MYLYGSDTKTRFFHKSAYLFPRGGAGAEAVSSHPWPALAAVAVVVNMCFYFLFS